MTEKFPIPQADRLVGKQELNPNEIEDHFGTPFIDAAGSVVTEPREILERVFKERASERYENEIDKSERDIEIINLATESVKELASTYGRNEFMALPLSNIHFLKPGGVLDMTNGRLEIGSHATVTGEIAVDRRSDLETAITTFHELWHSLASYKAIQVTTDGKIATYRSGFGMYSRDGGNEGFHLLDEALTGIATAKFVNEKLRNAEGFKNEISQQEQNEVHIDTTREKEISTFMDLVANLVERNSSQFSDKQEVVDIFLKAQVTGNVLLVARLIEASYGPGSFRKFSVF